MLIKGVVPENISPIQNMTMEYD